MEGVKKFLDTDGVYGEAAPDDPTGVRRKDELWADFKRAFTNQII